MGKSGHQVKGDLIKNVDKSGKSPARKPKTTNALKTPKAQKAKNKPANAKDDWIPSVTGTKSMLVCGSRINMVFPNYPSSGDVIDDISIRVNWEKVMVAYNAKEIDSCVDNYTFGRLAFPTTKKDHVHKYPKESTDGKKKGPHGYLAD